MRINKPQLFNGQYLASNDAILNAFFGAGKFLPNQQAFAPNADAKILSSLIDWSVVDADFISGKVNGSNIAISATSGNVSIIDYVDSVSGNLSTAIQNAITGAAADVSVVSGNLNTVSGNLNTVSANLNIVSDDLDTLETKVSGIGLVKDSDLTYKFTNAAGVVTTINIPEDQFLLSAEFLPSGDIEHTGPQLKFTWKLTNGVTTPSYVPVGDLVDTYTAADGIKLEGTEFKGVVDETSETFLTVGADGFKLTGVQDAINAASGAALKDAKAYADVLSAAVSGAAATKFGLVDQAIADANTLIGTTSGAIIDYVDGVSGYLNTAIGTASGTALKDAKAYADEVSGAVSGAADKQFTAEAAAREAADNFLSGSIDYVSGQVEGVAGYEVFAGDVSGLTSDEFDKLAKVGAVKTYVDAEVSKAVSGDVVGLLEAKVDKTQIASEVVAGDGLPTNDAVITYVTGYVAGHNAVYTTEDFADPADKTLTGLYVSAEGETKFWDGTEFIATSEEVADKFAGALSGAIPTVKAVEDYVAEQVAATVETVNTKAVEMIEDNDVEFGTDKDATVPGRVIAVYFADGEQCYPSISYADGISTISADAPVSSYTVIYAKRIGQADGKLPEYTNA